MGQSAASSARGDPAALRILLVEPYLTGSHKTWAEGLRRHSRHHVDILSLPGRHWKWRMHGGAVTLARAFLAQEQRPDLIIATDMLDLTTFLALTRPHTGEIPVALYVHENQFAYPWSPEDPDPGSGRDRHYGFLNFTSALAADRVLFNSAFNRDSFLTGARQLLQKMPDQRETASVDTVATKAEVLPLGLALSAFDEHRPTPEPDPGPPLILWNHRWEHDKNPEAFFRILTDLAAEGRDFRLAVLGAPSSNPPPTFDTARRQLADRIVAFGYADSFAAYARWLWAADLLPATSRHDFFGISVMEALYCRTRPLLPRRMAYPELLPASWAEHCLYDDEEELYRRLAERLDHGAEAGDMLTDLAATAGAYDWPRMAPRYDQTLAKIGPGG